MVGVESADGSHLIGPIALVDVFGHLIPAAGIKINVDIGLLSPLQAQKTFEEQPRLKASTLVISRQ